MTEPVSSEEEPLTLEEKIHSLQDQGLPPDKVVEKILDENMGADINILAETLHMDKLSIGRIKGRLSRLKKIRAQREKPTEPPKTEKGEPPSPYRDETDVNAILRKILSGHPDISQKTRDEVMDWAEMKGLLQPMELQSILMSMRGMSTQTANIIASKYSYAVVKAQQEGKLTLPPPIGGIPSQPQSQYFGQLPVGGPSLPFPSPATTLPGFPTPTGSTSQTQAPYWPPDIRGMIREELERVERSKPKEPEGYVDIEEPVRDSQGSVIIGPDDKPIMRRMRMPASQAGQLTPKEDVEMRVLEKMAHYKKLFGSEITEEKIRQIIKEAAPAPSTATEEKPVTLEDVKKASADAAETTVTKVLEAHEKEDAEERRHKEVLATIRESGSAKTVSDYKDDSYRILGQGLHEVASMAREKKPIEVILREGGPILFPGSKPGKQVESGAGKSLLDRLADRGLVVEE